MTPEISAAQSVRNQNISSKVDIGNVSSGNQPIHANYGNFNLSHTILVQRMAHGRWEG
jgi:hypothetical protein